MKRIPALFLALLFLLSGCGGNTVSEKLEFIPDETETLSIPVAEGAELIAAAETEEEALQIARLYGITLVSCGNHIAVFHTEEDPLQIIARGQANGWPELSLNEVITID